MNIELFKNGGVNNIYTKSGLLIANGLIRIVIGKRGPYAEFNNSQIYKNSIYVPKEQKYRLTDSRVYYDEYRTIDEYFVKVYHQKKTVKYADYKIGMWYISPHDLVCEEISTFIKKFI